MFAEYSIALVTKAQAAGLLSAHHYLTSLSRGFKSGVNYGLFDSALGLVGVCIYTQLPAPELAVGMLGLARDDQKGLFELSRLCLAPEVQVQGANVASFFVARTLRLLRKSYGVRAVLSYADASYHIGTVYQACNFSYYGLSAAKRDFWLRTPTGWLKHSRGRMSGLAGEWRPRSRKHRYLMVFNKKLLCLWPKQAYPKKVLV